MATAIKSPWIHLYHADDVEGVIVTTAADQTFTLPLDAVIRACGSVENVMQFTKQFQKLLVKLTTWLKKNWDDVDAAYITIRDAGLLFLLVRKTKRFNESLENRLTEIDLEIAQNKDFALLKLSVLALPKTSRECVDSFLASPSLKYAK